jgi:DNA-binding MarR family transcriptional regulator
MGRFLLTSQQLAGRQSIMRNTRPAPGSRYSALLRVLRSADGVWNASRVFFRRWDLSPSQFNVLNLACDKPDGLTQSQLSRELLMHRSNLTGLVDRLEARGLARRRQLEGDRRAHRVVLTAAGRKLLGRILPEYYAAAEEVWGPVSERRANELSIELGQIAANAGRVARRHAAAARSGLSHGPDTILMPGDRMDATAARQRKQQSQSNHT